MSENPKYLVYPGYVRGRHDDINYVSARELMALYGVSERQCVVVPWGNEESALAGRNKDDYTALRPRRSGNYKLPS